MWRAGCMHWSAPFDIGDLSILGFWYQQGSKNQSPMDIEGQLSIKCFYCE